MSFTYHYNWITWLLQSSNYLFLLRGIFGSSYNDFGKKKKVRCIILMLSSKKELDDIANPSRNRNIVMYAWNWRRTGFVWSNEISNSETHPSIPGNKKVGRKVPCTIRFQSFSLMCLVTYRANELGVKKQLAIEICKACEVSLMLVLLHSYI